MSRSGHGIYLIKIIGNIEVCTNFKMLKVKVPNLLYFSARRDRPY